MTIPLPTSWGPGTFLSVAIVLCVAVGGLVQVITGALTWDGYMDLLTHPGLGIIIGGLVIGRGVAYGGSGTGFGPGTDARKGVG